MWIEEWRRRGEEKRGFGNTPVMTIDEETFTPVQVGALLCFFKVQQHWANPMKFTRVPKDNKVAKRLKANKEDFE